MRTHNKHKKNKNQALNKGFLSSQVQFPKLSINNLVYKIFQWRWRKRKVFNILCQLQNSCKTIWPSVETIAHRAQVSPRYVQYCMDEFERDHILKREMRIYATNIYHINPTFLCYWVRKALKKFIPALAFVPLMIMAYAQAQNVYKKHQRLSAQVDRTIQEYEQFCTLLKKNTSYFKTRVENNSHLEKGGRAMASIFSQKEKNLIQGEYKRPKTGSYAIYRGEYIDHSSPTAVELTLERDPQFIKNLARLGIFNPDGFLTRNKEDRQECLSRSVAQEDDDSDTGYDDEITAIFHEAGESNESIWRT